MDKLRLMVDVADIIGCLLFAVILVVFVSWIAVDECVKRYRKWKGKEDCDEQE